MLRKRCPHGYLKNRVSLQRGGQTLASSDLGHTWRVGGQMIFRKRFWRKDCVKWSLPTIGLFNRDWISGRGCGIEGGKGAF